MNRLNLAYHAALSLPIGSSKLFNERWYDFDSSAGESKISRLLEDASRRCKPTDPLELRSRDYWQRFKEAKEQSTISPEERSAQIDADLKLSHLKRPMKIVMFGTYLASFESHIGLLTQLGSTLPSLQGVYNELRTEARIRQANQSGDEYKLEVFDYMCSNLHVACPRAELDGFEKRDSLMRVHSLSLILCFGT